MRLGDRRRAQRASAHAPAAPPVSTATLQAVSDHAAQGRGEPATRTAASNVALTYRRHHGTDPVLADSPAARRPAALLPSCATPSPCASSGSSRSSCSLRSPPPIRHRARICRSLAAAGQWPSRRRARHRPSSRRSRWDAAVTWNSHDRRVPQLLRSAAPTDGRSRWTPVTAELTRVP